MEQNRSPEKKTYGSLNLMHKHGISKLQGKDRFFFKINGVGTSIWEKNKLNPDCIPQITNKSGI